MSRSISQGAPCWYELATPDLDAAASFYGSVLGWTFADSGTPDYPYHLINSAEGALIAGAFATDADAEPVQPRWVVYFSVDDGDEAVAQIKDLGGTVKTELQDVPGTGRFAVCADPQGATFGILQDEPMDDPIQMPSPFDSAKPGHAQWHELMTPDPDVDLGFYEQILGWYRGDFLDMGPAGDYQIFLHQGVQLGGVMGLGDAPEPAWLPYFGVSDINTQATAITEAGGKIIHGPAEVPGGDQIVIAEDPEGAYFALVTTGRR